MQNTLATIIVMRYFSGHLVHKTAPLTLYGSALLGMLILDALPIARDPLQGNGALPRSKPQAAAAAPLPCYPSGMMRANVGLTAASNEPSRNLCVSTVDERGAGRRRQRDDSPRYLVRDTRRPTGSRCINCVEENWETMSPK
ncbi:hypothetical protein DL764_007409 [Monosporascus ibericus]|uniref:Uncharacterized protein n=1 Tax=Monosporascus ibericus TaxID=155417 RepID=A0A4Q4T0X9_9PEZI|nr:hypothetical protein DL764_007409 [Monosporascus ibericus]